MKTGIIRKIYAILPKIIQKLLKPIYYDWILYPLYGLKHKLYYGKWDFFDTIAIETTTYCNLRCKNCPNSLYERGIMKNRKLMDISLFKKIIEDLAKMNYRGWILMHFYGEPLTDERLPELVKYAREKLPKSTIQINSNGFLMTIPLYKKLLNSGVNQFFVTQYGGTMPSKIKELFDYLKDKPKKERKIEYRVLGENLGLSNRGGEINVKKVADYERPICAYPSVGINVDYSGNVVLCCNDYHSSVKFGNASKENIADIWNSKSYKKLRYDIRRGVYKLPICKKCVGIKELD